MAENPNEIRLENRERYRGGWLGRFAYRIQIDRESAHEMRLQLSD